jgi:hypothetical protein
MFCTIREGFKTCSKKSLVITRSYSSKRSEVSKSHDKSLTKNSPLKLFWSKYFLAKGLSTK